MHEQMGNCNRDMEAIFKKPNGNIRNEKHDDIKDEILQCAD